jgi:hypothetical protein
MAGAAGIKGAWTAFRAGDEIALPLTWACAARLVPLVESGMITQQQLRTSPRVSRVVSLTIRLREFHTLEIRSPIPTRSVRVGVWFPFMKFFILIYTLRKRLHSRRLEHPSVSRIHVDHSGQGPGQQ